LGYLQDNFRRGLIILSLSEFLRATVGRLSPPHSGGGKEGTGMLNRKMRKDGGFVAVVAFSGGRVFSAKTSAYPGSGEKPPEAASDAPDLKDLDSSPSELRSLIERYVADRGSLSRSYPVEISPARQARFKQFYSDWLATLAKLNFDSLSQDGKVDYLL